MPGTRTWSIEKFAPLSTATCASVASWVTSMWDATGLFRSLAGQQPGSSVEELSRNGRVLAIPVSAEAAAADRPNAAIDAVAASARRDGLAFLVTLNIGGCSVR